MRDQIKAVLAEVFGLPVAAIPDDAAAESLPGWDSLHHLEIMLGIEIEFGVQVSAEVMPGLLSLEAIERYLLEQRSPASP